MSLLKAPGLNVNGLGTNLVDLEPGEAWIIGPEAGFYLVISSRYHSVQYRDPISGLWQGIGDSYTAGVAKPIYSDGRNYRIVNQTGCAVGALLTNAGSGYTSAPTVTPSAGGSTWSAIVGSVVSATVVVTNAGVNYTYPPIVVFSPPPTGGLQATGYAAISGGVVTGVTVTNQGAGYISPPTITFLNDPRELDNPNLIPGYGAAAAASLTGGGTVNAVVCTNHGGAAGALSSLPTLSFAGGGGASAAATVIMNWSIKSYAAGTAGAGLAGTAAIITALDAFPTTAAAYTNPKTQSGLVSTRQAIIYAPTSAGGITATGQVVYDGGCYTSSPVPIVQPTASVVTTAPVVTFTMGGFGGTSYVTQIG